MWGRFATALPLLIYQLCYFKSYFPITEGWFSTYGWLIRNGQVPYRDFDLLLPPLYPLQIAFVQSLFGESFFALRCIGVFVTCCIGIALYDCLLCLFNRWVSAFSAASAIIYYQSGNAFIGYDFTQFVTLYSLIGGAFLVAWADGMLGRAPERKLHRLASTAGLFFALAVLVKQSNGGLTALCAGLAMTVIALRIAPVHRAFLHIGWFAAGGSLPVFAILFWLATQGALGAFFEQVVFAASAAKGGPHVMFFGWIHGFFAGGQYPLFAGLLLQRLVGIGAAVAVPILVIRIAIALIKKKSSSPMAVLTAVLSPRQIRGLGAERAGPPLCGLAIVSLSYLILHIYQTGCTFCIERRDNILVIYNSIIFLSAHIYVIGFFICLATLLLRPRPTSILLLVLCAIGIGLTVGNGTSAGLSEISAFVGLAIAQAALLQLSLPYVLPAIVPIALSLAFSGFLIEKKFENPYYWWSVVSSDVRRSACAKSQGLLHWICVEPSKYEKIKRLAEDIRTNTQSGDAIYVFPHLPIFYLLTNRPPFAGAVVSWFDFMSDAEADRLNAKLAIDPPQLMIIVRLPEEIYAAHERLFRSGQPSAQRRLLQTIDALASTGIIHRIDMVTDLDGLTMDVYRRRPLSP